MKNKRLVKAQRGLNLSEKIATGIGTAMTGIGMLAEKRRRKKLAEEEARKKAQTFSDEKIQGTQLKNEEGAKEFKRGGAMKRMKTGGMVNTNTKVSALKSAGSKGVKSGVNTKASASKKATGRVGGTSTAPKTAVPKAKRGGVMRKK